MTFQSSWLYEYKKNIFSQNGEDGIIEKILEIINEKDNWCVEFGAWDGEHFSNTYNLIKNYGYNAVLIEGDPDKAAKLHEKYKNNKNIITFNKLVGFDKDKLDDILKKTPISYNFDFLSIDVDGNDYHIWKAFNEYRPKVVCIEFNPSIPNEVEFVQKADERKNQGCSLLSLVNLGKTKGYELVCATEINAIFVDKIYFDKFSIQNNSIHELNKNNPYITYLYVGYDATVFLTGRKDLVWHDIKYKFIKLPKFLRKFPGSFNPLEKQLYKLSK